MMSLGVMPGLAFAGITCTISTTTVAFGAYNVLSSTDNTTAGNIRISCTNVNTGVIASTLQVSSGAAGGTWATSRLMTGAGNLNYQIYRDSARTVVWDANAAYSDPGINVVTANVYAFIDVPVYGKIPNQQNVANGSYSDSLAITVTF